MFPLKIIKFFIRVKMFVNLEAHKRQQNLFMKCINSANTWNFNMNANTFYNLFLNLESIGNKGE